MKISAEAKYTLELNQDEFDMLLRLETDARGAPRTTEEKLVLSNMIEAFKAVDIR